MKKNVWVVFFIVLCVLFFSLGYWKHRAGHNTVSAETLSNGLEILVIPTDSPLVSVQLWIRTGSRNETPLNNGISHYLEHLLFKNKYLVSALESSGGAMNGATSRDFTYYYVTLPGKNLIQPLQHLCDLVFTATFNAEDALQEKKVILEEIARGNDNPERQLYDILHEKTYDTHPYARTVLGTKKTVGALTYDQLRDYYATWYVPNNATLVIAGNISREAARKTARTVASQYAPRATPVQQQRTVIDFLPNYTTYEIANLSFPRYTVAYSVPGYGSADTYALDVLCYILANRTTALLNTRLKEKLDLVYNLDCYYQTYKDRSLFVIDCQIKKPYELSRLRQEIENTMQRMPISQEDVQLAKTRLQADHFLAQESAEQLAAAYGYYNTIGDYEYEQHYIQNIKKVGAKDIQKIVSRYFKDSMQFVFIRRLPQ